MQKTKIAKRQDEFLIVKRKNRGFTLLETLVSLALIAVLSILTANLINTLISSKDVFEKNESSSIVSLWQFLLPVKNSMETIIERKVQENMNRIDAAKIIWNPDTNTISWVSNSGFAIKGGDNYSRLRRQRLVFSNNSLYLQSTGELDSPAMPSWQTEKILHNVEKWNWQFYENRKWRATPTDATQGAKLTLTYLGQEAQMTFFFAEY